MKRYCDYDYDNNCIILFDAEDAEEINDPFQLKFSWSFKGHFLFIFWMDNF